MFASNAFPRLNSCFDRTSRLCAATSLYSSKMNLGAAGVGHGMSITFLIVDIRLSGQSASACAFSSACSLTNKRGPVSQSSGRLAGCVDFLSPLRLICFLACSICFSACSVCFSACSVCPSASSVSCAKCPSASSIGNWVFAASLSGACEREKGK